MLQDRREGYLVAPGSVDELAAVLVEAWQMREGLRAMGRAGRERFAEQFSCARVVAQMEALYSQCLAEAR
jgi:glycosyltransferase involved in cell wall biosynthesis